MKLPDPSELKGLSDEELRGLMVHILEVQQEERKQNQLQYYRPVSKDSIQIHTRPGKVLAAFGGNGSSKTETSLVELLICATGIIPDSLKGIWDESKLRGPLNCRVVVESLTTVLHPIILPKLQWWNWTGVGEPGTEQGHWGWIPKDRLIDGRWDKSWSEKLRTLRVIYIDPETGRKGESKIQFMSHDQDPSDFASGDFHIVLHDEPPSYAIWRENQARTMRVNGRMMLAMTWPDDPAIAVDWIFDEVYDPGTPGPNKNPNIDWVNLYTTDNPFLNQDAIATQAESWSEEVRKVRIMGQPIRFSNRIHPLFTDITQYWCSSCGKTVMPMKGKCQCGEDVISFNHVVEDEPHQTWPTVFLLDPHPRKPHMMSWAQVTPYDDYIQVAEASVDGDPTEVKKRVDDVEEALKLNVCLRLIDPNMGLSPSGAKRGITWQQEFDDAGLFCDLADDSDVGRSRLNEYLKPDKYTGEPRFRIRSTCSDTIFQMKRYVWDDYRMKLEKELKQKPKPKNDDFPTLLKYLMNFQPGFRFLTAGAPVIKRAGRM